MSVARKLLISRPACRSRLSLGLVIVLLWILYSESGALLEAVDADDEFARLRVCLGGAEEPSRMVPFFRFASWLPKERLLMRSATCPSFVDGRPMILWVRLTTLLLWQWWLRTGVKIGRKS